MSRVMGCVKMCKTDPVALDSQLADNDETVCRVQETESGARYLILWLAGKDDDWYCRCHRTFREPQFMS